MVFFRRVGGCDRDEGQDGFLTGGTGAGGGVLMGRRADVTVFVK